MMIRIRYIPLKPCFAAFLLQAVGLLAVSRMDAQTPEYNPLTPAQEWVILHKGTERPGSGVWLSNKDKGTYICARCNERSALPE